MASKPSIGGQAVMEGVMMRGPKSWAVAVRKPDKEIAVETHMLPAAAERHAWLKWPLIRGVYILGESLHVGFKAFAIAARHALEDEPKNPPPEGVEGISKDAEGESSKVESAMGWSMALAMVFFLGLFIIGPAFLAKVGGRRIGIESDLMQNLFEGGVRLSVFVGYILLISLIPDIRRVFQYHGAEHKTIYAYENDDPFEPEVIDRYSTLHVRCGTNFLFIVMFLAILGHLIADMSLPNVLALRIGARVLMIPLLAAVSYEVIRAAGQREESIALRIVSLPGLGLQKITTRPPDRDQIEVAIKAMEAVIARESLAQESSARQIVSEPVATVFQPKPGTAPATPT